MPDVFTSVHQFRGTGTEATTAAMFSPSTGVPPLLWCSLVRRSAVRLVPGLCQRQNMQPLAVSFATLTLHTHMCAAEQIVNRQNTVDLVQAPTRESYSTMTS